MRRSLCKTTLKLRGWQWLELQPRCLASAAPALHSSGAVCALATSCSVDMPSSALASSLQTAPAACQVPHLHQLHDQRHCDGHACAATQLPLASRQTASTAAAATAAAGLAAVLLGSSLATSANHGPENQQLSASHASAPLRPLPLGETLRAAAAASAPPAGESGITRPLGFRLQLQNQEPAAAPQAPSPKPPAAAPPPSPSQQHQGPPAAAQPGASPSRPASFAEGSAFAVYDSAGAPASFRQLLASLDSYDVVLLGEYHDDPVAHALQLRLLRHALGLGADGTDGGDGAEREERAHGEQARAGQQQGRQEADQQAQGAGQGRRRRPVALSLEMFERDVQGVMDEYLAGVLTEADLMKDARPWPNYASDYRPLVLAAKQAGARVVCANAPRRYVSLVGRRGAGALQSLPPASRPHLPPLPLRPPSHTYAAKIRWSMQRARESAARDEGREGQAGAEQDAEEDEEVAAPLATAAAASAPTTHTAPHSSSTAAGGAASSSSGGDAGGGGASGASGGSGGGACPHIGLGVRSNFLDAQNLWDATMADSIGRALREMRREAQRKRQGATSGGSAGGGGGLVVHVCGKFHSEQRLGICEHLAASGAAEASGASEAGQGAAEAAAARPEADAAAEAAGGSPRVCVVTFVPSGRGVGVPQETLTSARLHTYGDWLVLTDARLPRSFDSQHPL